MGRYIDNALSDLAKALYRLIDIAMEHDLSSDELMELGGCCPVCGMDWYEGEEEE